MTLNFSDSASFAWLNTVVYVAQLCLAQWTPVQGSEGLLATFCDMTAGIGPSFRTHRRNHGRTDGQTDVEVEIVI